MGLKNSKTSKINWQHYDKKGNNSINKHNNQKLQTEQNKPNNKPGVIAYALEREADTASYGKKCYAAQ